MSSHSTEHSPKFTPPLQLRFCQPGTPRIPGTSFKVSVPRLCAIAQKRGVSKRDGVVVSVRDLCVLGAW